MVQLYLMMIHRGSITITDVPALWRDKVEAALKQNNS